LDNTVVLCRKDGTINHIYSNSDVDVLLLDQDGNTSSLEELPVKSGKFASDFVSYLRNYEGKEPFCLEDWQFNN
jgi:hypothetical protein